MEFCDICNNMLYVKSNENKKLVKFCKHCTFQKEETNTNAIKISETIYTEDDLLYNQHINKYLRHDPTLRRIKDNVIKCTNCDIDDDKQQLLYVKYHPSNMSYFYVCDNCGFIWRQNKK
jgi:DNA-directed RNA polymerase subunit M/transcription elongation factor TFIIS